MEEKTIFFLSVVITGFLGLMVYLNGADTSNDQYRHEHTLTNRMAKPPVKISVTEKSVVNVLPLRKKDGLTCVDGGKGCFCTDTYGKNYLTSKDQCVETVNAATEHPYQADASTLERLERQKQFVREAEAKREEDQKASKLTTSIFVVSPSTCPQYAIEIRRQNPKITECVMTGSSTK